MDWNIFSRGHSSKPKNNSFDKKLLLHVRKNFFPSWRQMRYWRQFLSHTEKMIINICLAVVVVTGVSWLGYFAWNHLETTPKAGGEYTEAMVGQPKFVNPIFSTSNDVDADLCSLIYTGLVRIGPDGKILPDLAAGYTVSADQKTYTFSLRQDVKWSDGEKFNADDIIFTFETIQNPEVGSPLINTFKGVTVEKIDDFTVNLTLKEPFAPFLTALTVGIIPEHVWRDIPPINLKLAKNNLQPIGTGPFVFNKLVKDETGNIQSYTVNSNSNFYRSAAYLQTLTFRFYTDYNQAAEALRAQTVTGLSFAPREYWDKIASKNVAFYPLRLPQYTALFFNPDQETDLKDANLRRALALAIDKNQIIKTVLGNQGTVIDGPIVKGQVGYDANIKKIAFSADEANALLDKNWKRIQPEEYFEVRRTQILKNYQAEIDALKKNPSSTPEMVSSTIEKIGQDADTAVRKEMTSNQTFYRQNKDKKILSLTIATGDTDEYVKTAELTANMWRALGIQVSIQSLPSRALTHDVIKSRSYQVLLYAEIIGADPDLYPFWHSSQTDYPGLNLSEFVNRAGDKILEDARAQTDTAKRDALYKKFQQILVDELPAIFLYTPNYNLAINKQIRGVTGGEIFTPSDRYRDITSWYTKTGHKWK